MTPNPVLVIGVGADGPAGLRYEQVERVRSADLVAGGQRHLELFPDLKGERFVIKNNLTALLDMLKEHRTRRRVVLASGDPLFYGVGSYLLGHLDPDELQIEPAVSSMQLAFARAGVAWDNAALASVHGRDMRATLLPLLGRPLLGLFTKDGNTPGLVAQFFLEHGVTAYQARVAENLGAARETVSGWLSLEQLRQGLFAPLNYLILRRTLFPTELAERRHYRSLVPGAPDDAFAQPEHRPLPLTHQEVRAVVLAKLLGPTEPGDTVWDIGAGLGSVAVEVAVLRPHAEVVAVEQDPDRAALLAVNRSRFDACNLRVVTGTAPEALAAEAERPRYAFVGGSGGHLGEILDLAYRQLRRGGRLVGAFVTLENLHQTLERLRIWQWPFAITEVHVARSDALAGLTGLQPLRGVFLVRADKPAGTTEIRVP